MLSILKIPTISISICIFLGNCSTFNDAQAILSETRSEIEKNAQVYEEDANLKILCFECCLQFPFLS